MSKPGFLLGNKPIKDMTDEELKEAQEQIGGEMQLVAANLNRCIQQMQFTASMLNVCNYELDRRANSIQIARTLPK
jgi:hypothetical protein